MIIRHHRTIYACLRSTFPAFKDTNMRFLEAKEGELNHCHGNHHINIVPNLCLEKRFNKIWRRVFSECPSIVENGLHVDAPHHPEKVEGLWNRDTVQSKSKQIVDKPDIVVPDIVVPDIVVPDIVENCVKESKTKGIGGASKQSKICSIEKDAYIGQSERSVYKKGPQRSEKIEKVDTLIQQLRTAREVNGSSVVASALENTELRLAVETLLNKFSKGVNNWTLQKLINAFKSDSPLAVMVFEWAIGQKNFKSNKYSLFSLLNVVGRAKHLNKMQELLQNYDSLVGMPPDVVVYTDIMKSYSLAQRYDDMFLVFKDMVRKGIQPTVVTYSVIIGGLVAAGRVEAAMEIQKEIEASNVRPNAQLYGDLIALCGKTQPARAESLLEEMKTAGVVPEVYHFNRVLAIHFQNQQQERGLSLFQRMVDGESPPNRVTYITLLDHFAKRGMVDAAKKVLDEISTSKDVQLEVRFFNIVINMYVQHKRLDEAKALYGDMLTKGLKPNQVTYSTLIFGCLKKQDYEEAILTVKAMRKEGIPMTLFGYTSVVNLCIRCNNEEDVQRLLDCVEACGHRCHDFILLMLRPQATGTEFWKEVEKHLEGLIQEDSASRTAFLNALITSLAKVGLKRRASHVWKKARSGGLLDSTCYETTTSWVVNIHNLSQSTAEIALFFELLGLLYLLENVEKVPGQICIITGCGRSPYTNYSYIKKIVPGWGHGGSYTDHMYMTNFVVQKLESLSSPFVFSPNDAGCLVAKTDAVWKWLRQESVQEELYLQDG